MQKKDGRNRSASAQAVIREQVVEYLRKKRGTQQTCAEVFGIHLRSVQRIWYRYQEGGKRAISEKKRGVQGGKKINGKQASEVRQLIKDKLPDHLKLLFGFWTREAVKQLILDTYGIWLSRWQGSGIYGVGNIPLKNPYVRHLSKSLNKFVSG